MYYRIVCLHPIGSNFCALISVVLVGHRSQMYIYIIFILGVIDFSHVDKPPTIAESSYLNKILRTKLINNSNDVEVQRKDPNSPLYSVKSFEELRL